MARDSILVLGEYSTWAGIEYAPKTSLYYERTVLRFFLANTVPVHKVTELMVASWLETYPHRSSARRTSYNALLSFFSWCHRNGYVATNPCQHIRVASPTQKEREALTPDQYEAIRQAAYAHAPMRGYAVELLYYSAARINELLNLTWDDVGAEGLRLRKTKGMRRERTVLWSPGLQRAITGLRSHFGECERVLPRSQQCVWGWVRDAGQEAGVGRVYPHLFRSTAATTMLDRGAPITAVRDVLGHENLRTTDRYAASEAEGQRQALSLL